MKRFLIHWMLLVSVLACQNRKPPPAAHTAVQPLLPQMGLGISEDREQLGRLLNLNLYPPTGVTYQWNGQNRNGLEAVLYYDEKTYGEILNAYMEAGFPKGNSIKEQFSFSWLDSAQQAELRFSKPDYTGNPDIFLGTQGKGMLWFLDKKILLKVAP
ncbi:hypothetical protein LL912_11270 [Niabella sp. CC-SYL272]|uniref:hypothetical protein n=1 Tax=Niabella agricola TaxID=2891571 RepID=UPI001F1772C2|nr:hypothetical protein [Niabella agricola]MCF3109357.1 hypothetical protein [Niabella agricola]